MSLPKLSLGSILYMLLWVTNYEDCWILSAIAGFASILRSNSEAEQDENVPMYGEEGASY